jgi:hypothetical protein
MTPGADWNDVSRNWKAPSAVAGSGPREVRLTAGGKALTLLSLLMLLGAATMFVFLSRQGQREAAERAALDVGSVETQATVTRHWRTGGKSDTPKVAYEFEYQGRKYHGSSSAPRAQWRDLTVGSPIGVRFLPTNPELNHPSGWTIHVIAPWMPPLMSSIFAITALLPLWITRRDSRLLRDGRAAPARVTGARRTKGGYAVLYEFRLPDGSVRRGRSGPTRKPPDTGDVITILYDPESPRRNAAYPLRLARVER